MEIFLLFYSDPSSLSDVEISLSLNADFGMAIRIGIFKPCFAKHLERVVDSMEMTI
ncbi:hypothetical protein RO3G_04378 [Rhizopus delemar RA 99-880]|uniref:Uncharacterized protein n=1 Tax=Rhizopus delemar (strain RA 99-880 / ATCC MYA-4621 / FGSC 9543 / NRRL 43880) TaxID=246409 RepID=I1BTZ3_RHIO9|nr:hypothetical protein RO3G_04378 [Rhizopus delemar RA 99-880]|eukprot:EIE79673.1 hypothetical protein RO3G_04378 [Rhizopus delemar RA 99-880]